MFWFVNVYGMRVGMVPGHWYSAKIEDYLGRAIYVRDDSRDKHDFTLTDMWSLSKPVTEARTVTPEEVTRASEQLRGWVRLDTPVSVIKSSGFFATVDLRKIREYSEVGFGLVDNLTGHRLIVLPAECARIRFEQDANSSSVTFYGLGIGGTVIRVSDRPIKSDDPFANFSKTVH